MRSEWQAKRFFQLKKISNDKCGPETIIPLTLKDSRVFPKPQHLIAKKPTWYISWHFLTAASSGGFRHLGIAFIKFMFKYTKQAGDPVVQAHVQNKLMIQKWGKC